MDFDRDRQGSTGDSAATGDRSAGDPSTTGDPAPGNPSIADPSIPRDQPATGGTERGGPFSATPDDTGARAGSFDRKFTGEESDGAERISEKVGAGRERLSGVVGAGRNRVAGQLERLGDRLEERGRGMEQAGGVQQRASQVALRAGEALDSGAEYLRTHEPDEMRDDLERSIRERPLLSVGIAAGAGFLLARLLRE